MMGSRGETPPQVTALVNIGEILALLKSAEPTLAALKAESVAIAEARARLAEYDQAHADRAAALDEIAKGLDKREAEINTRAAEVQAGAEKTGQMQATFDKQSADLAVREALLTRKTEEHAQVAKAFTEECAVTRAALATEQREQLEALAKDRQQLQTDAALSREAQQADAQEIIARAREEAGRVHTELTAREAVITARETAFKQRTAELRAALPE
jgi:hypothetical protein